MLIGSVNEIVAIRVKTLCAEKRHQQQIKFSKTNILTPFCTELTGLLLAVAEYKKMSALLLGNRFLTVMNRLHAPLSTPVDSAPQVK